MGSAEGAKWNVANEKMVIALPSASFRAFSAKEFQPIHLGRWPRLLHFAPLALKTQSFHTVSVAGGFSLKGYQIVAGGRSVA